MNGEAGYQPEDLSRPNIGMITGSPFAIIEPNPAMRLTTQNEWGRSAEILEATHEQIVRIQSPNIMSFFVVTVRAVNVSSGTNATQVYPMAKVSWGNGNVLTDDIIDCTGGAQIVVNGTTVYVEVFLADKAGNAPATGSAASATFYGQASVGLVPYPELNTSFASTTSTSPATLISGMQGRLASISGFVDNTGATPSYLMVFDSSSPPTNAGPNGPLLLVIPIPVAGVVSFDKQFANTLRFLNGISVGLSSSASAFNNAGVASTGLFVAAEQVNN